jgi:hypothetical protein
MDALASFYGLRPSLVRQLVTWSELQGMALADAVLAEAIDVLGVEDEEPDLDDDVPDDDVLTALVMRMARRSAPVPEGRLGPSEAPAQQMFLSFTRGEINWDALQRDGESADAVALLSDFLSLDRRRQRALRELAADLRLARERERTRQRARGEHD